MGDIVLWFFAIIGIITVSIVLITLIVGGVTNTITRTDKNVGFEKLCEDLGIEFHYEN